MVKRRAVGIVKAARHSGGPRKVQTSKAKVHLPKLLREVERGESLIITRHGREIARIVPGAGVDRAVSKVEELNWGGRRVKLRPVADAGEQG
jgi:prevent-host-death family protein